MWWMITYFLWLFHNIYVCHRLFRWLTGEEFARQFRRQGRCGFAEDVGFIPGSGRSLGGGNGSPLQYSLPLNHLGSPQSLGTLLLQGWTAVLLLQLWALILSSLSSQNKGLFSVPWSKNLHTSREEVLRFQNAVILINKLSPIFAS